MNLPHLPALRRGKPYESLDKVDVLNHRTGQPMATVSQVGAGILRKDLARVGEARAVLKKFSVADLIEISSRAGEHFLNGTLPLGDKGHTQSPREYIETLSASSGLPYIMVKRNMAKIHFALTNVRTVLNGLTRGLPLDVLDRGYGEQSGAAVNSLWLPAIALKTPVIIKPGREEPWTPFRLIQAFVAAGAPPEAFGFYPTDHEGSGEVMKLCGRALIFGDAGTVAQYRDNPRFSVHGPGFSKILIGDDEIGNWRDYIDLMAASISENGGRSCVNASAIVVPKHAAEIAEALAERLGPIAPAAPTDESARLSGFANPKMAEFIDAAIEEGLKTPGAVDVTAKHRYGPRKTEFEGGVYLRPTIVLCDSFQHPLANREYLFPYASVVETPQSEMLKQIGPSLVVTAITKNPEFTAQLLDSSLIERLNLGPVPTMKISWDQPHEGNMFEFLYKRRSIERGW
jgi:hypothetical protein